MVSTVSLESLIVRLYDEEDMDFKEIKEEIEDSFSIPISVGEVRDIYDLHWNNKVSTAVVKMPEMHIDIHNAFIKKKMKKVQFIDIETSLVEARVFRTGKQDISASQMTGVTKILTVAGGSFYDLYTKGEAGIWGYGNHMFDTFTQDPLDDTEVLRKVWEILDKSDVIVAHNAQFDKSWLFGRFLSLGWKLPSRFSVVCTYSNLAGFNMTSKKLDELSKNLIGTRKLHTDISLWMGCSDGDRASFERMLEYNKGDIYDTLFKVYMRTCQYNADRSVDLSDPRSRKPQCKLTGQELRLLDEVHFDKKNGLSYSLYVNPVNGVMYVNRYNTNSSKSILNLIKQYK